MANIPRSKGGGPLLADTLTHYSFSHKNLLSPKSARGHLSLPHRAGHTLHSYQVASAVRPDSKNWFTPTASLNCLPLPLPLTLLIREITTILSLNIKFK